MNIENINFLFTPYYFSNIFFFFCAFRFAWVWLRIGDFWVEGYRKKRFLFQVLGFVSKMDFGVLMCVLVAMVGVKRRWEWILECLARSLVDFSEFVMVVAGGLCFVGLIWVFWVVLSGLLCGWWWVLVFCWVYGGGSWCFARFVVVVQLFFVWVGLVGDVGE